MKNDRIQFGWLDTTIFCHVLFENDPHQGPCQRILEALENGQGEGWLDPIVIHELTYVLPRCNPSFRDRQQVFQYVVHFLLLDGIHTTNKEILIEMMRLWAETGLGFADARLTTLASADGLPVCSVNGDDFRGVENSYKPLDPG